MTFTLQRPIALFSLAVSYSTLSLFSGRRNGDNDKNYDTMDLPKRTEPTKGTWRDVDTSLARHRDRSVAFCLRSIDPSYVCENVKRVLLI